MATGTPNPDFNAEPWCSDAPTQPEIILVQADMSELPPEPPVQQ